MSEKQYAITPLAAAIVEAMPDEQAVRRVKAAFRRGRGVASAMYSQAEADDWAVKFKQEERGNE